MVVALAPEDALAHPARAALHAAVLESPGITFRAVSRRVGRASGTVRHHLTALIRCGLLREQAVGCTLTYMPADDKRSPAVLSVLREPGMAALRDVVASAGRV